MNEFYKSVELTREVDHIEVIACHKFDVHSRPLASRVRRPFDMARRALIEDFTGRRCIGDWVCKSTENGESNGEEDSLEHDR